MRRYWLLLGLLLLMTGVRADDTLTFEAVEHITLGDAVIVTLEEAEVARIQVSGSAEAMEKLQAEQRDGKLVLKTTKSFWHFLSSSKARKYRVQIPRGSLRRLSLSGGSMLEAPTLTAKALMLEASGAGKLRLDALAVDSLDLAAAGAGRIDIHQLAGPLSHLHAELAGSSHLQLPVIDAGQLQVKGSGASHLVIEGVQAEVFDVHLSGAANLKVKGRGEIRQQRLDASGASDYRADHLLVQQAQVSASGGSSVRLHATGMLNANLSGGSSLHYAGNPRTHISNSGGSHAKAL